MHLPACPTPLQFCFEIICVDQDGNIKAAKVDRQGRYVQGLGARGIAIAVAEAMAGRHTTYKIQAKDRAEMEDWVKCIKGAMMKDPIFELYRQKRVDVSTK